MERNPRAFNYLSKEFIIANLTEKSNTWINFHLQGKGTDWIDADSYINLSLAGKATNQPLDIILHWTDGKGTPGYIDTGINLTSSWQEFDPVDLSDISGSTWGDSIETLWLEFDGGNIDTDIRIGWIKLTE